MARHGAKGFTDEDDALLAELGVEAEAKKQSSRTPREERIIAGFEEIQRFVEQHGRSPQHGEDRDIFERLYAVRLDRLRALVADCRAIIEPLDHQGLLTGDAAVPASVSDDIDDDELLAQLGVDDTAPDDLTDLRHVRSAAEKRAAEEIANRTKCQDFEKFRPLFEVVQVELESGVRETRPFGRDTEILARHFFILGGQKAYVHELGPVFPTPEGRTNRRMRVIFDNGTEINTLMRSFQRALYKEENHGRRITEPSAGPLFSDRLAEDDQAAGTVYVLRSKSDHPVVAANRDLVHKIGVTSRDITQRIAGARLQPTYLMGDVEIVETYKLYNINRTKLEKLIHRIFDPVRLNIEIMDRFGNLVTPQEWFLVPRFVIDEAINRIRDGTISNYRYDPKAAALVRVT